MKDIGLIGQEGGWQVVVGGAAGKRVRKADLLIDRRDDRAGARGRRSSSSSTTARTPTTSSAPTTSSSGSGIEKVRKETVYAPDAVRHGAARSAAQVEGARHATRGSKGATPRTSDAVHSASSRSRRCSHERTPLDSRDGGRQHPAARGARRAGRPAARSRIFNLGDRFLAIDNQCPHKGGPLVRRHRHRRRRSSARCTRGRSTSRRGAVERPTHGPRSLRRRPTRRAWRTACRDACAAVTGAQAAAGGGGRTRSGVNGIPARGAHADARRGAALLRRQLHGLGAARAAGAVPARGARADRDADRGSSPRFRCSADRSSGRCSGCSATASAAGAPASSAWC